MPERRVWWTNRSWIPGRCHECGKLTAFRGAYCEPCRKLLWQWAGWLDRTGR